MDPPFHDTYINRAVLPMEEPPMLSTNAQDMTAAHVSPYRHWSKSNMDQSEEPIHRWMATESQTTGSQHQNAAAKHQGQGGDVYTSSNGRETFNYSSRTNSRDHSGNDGPRPFTVSAKQPPNTIRSSLPASVIVSPNYEDDEDVLPSSLSSLRSFEPWESSVQPPPFVNESQTMSDNHYNDISAPSATSTRRYNDVESHKSIYNGTSINRYDKYSYPQESDFPAQGYSGYSDVPAHSRPVFVENDYSRHTGSWNHGANCHGTTTSNRRGYGGSATAAVEPKMIEITPGNMSRLRDAQETIAAIKNDFYTPCTCTFCNIISSSSLSSSYGVNNGIDTSASCEPIFCIQDAEYFLCPHCASINRVHAENNDSPTRKGAFHIEGGVGLGFTAKTLLEVQRDFIIKRRTP
jgi:hypothetical protein